MKSLFRLIRLPNLVIVAATQYALQYAILLPELGKIGLKPLLPDLQFFLLVCSTVLIAAGGYVVNDIEDVDIEYYLDQAEVHGKPYHMIGVTATTPLMPDAWAMAMRSVR